MIVVQKCIILAGFVEQKKKEILNYCSSQMYNRTQLFLAYPSNNVSTQSGLHPYLYLCSCFFRLQLILVYMCSCRNPQYYHKWRWDHNHEDLPRIR